MYNIIINNKNFMILLMTHFLEQSWKEESCTKLPAAVWLHEAWWCWNSDLTVELTSVSEGWSELFDFHVCICEGLHAFVSAETFMKHLAPGPFSWVKYTVIKLQERLVMRAGYLTVASFSPAASVVLCSSALRSKEAASGTVGLFHKIPLRLESNSGRDFMSCWR